MTGRVKLLAVSETQYGDEYKADYIWNSIYRWPLTVPSGITTVQRTAAH